MTDRRFPPKIALPGSHLQRSLEKAGRFGGDGSFNSLVVALGVTIGDGLGVGGNAIIGGTFEVVGASTLDGDLLVKGNTTLGDTTSDTITVTGRLASSLVPTTANSYDLGDALLTWANGYFQGTVYAGGLASLQASDPLASLSATTPITLRDYGRQVVEHRTDSITALDGPGMHFVRRSAAGGAAQVNWLVGEFSFSGGYGSGSQTLVNAGIYAQARETFTTYGTHGATDLVFATKASGTGSNRAAEVLRILAEGHTVPQTDNTLDLGADATTGGTLRRWRSVRIGTDLRIDAGTGSGGIVHIYERSAAGVLRWGQGLLNTESSGNAGSDYALWRYSDTGVLLGNWLTVTRSSGAWTITGNGNVTGTLAASSTVQGTQLISTVATGTAPLTVASTTLVTNLHADNSDKLGGTVAASYALLASPTFTGTPAAPTAAPGTNTTQLATTAFVQAATGALVTGVSSVFGRTGAVVATSGDYSFSLISGIIDTAQVSGAYSGITGVGTLASGAVPASLVTAGTFGAGSYTFPSALTVSGNLNGTSVGNTFGSNAGASQTVVLNSASTGSRLISFRSAGTARWNLLVAGTTQLLSIQAVDASGVLIDSPFTIDNTAGGNISLVRPLTTTKQVTSTLATGTSPFAVTSTTVNTNLNADLLDGQHGAYYNDATNLTGTIASARVAGSYTGITGVGTLSAGTWNAGVISEVYGGTNQSSYTLGDLLYASAANTLSKLAGNTTTTKKFLTQTGTGAVSAAPAWGTVGAADVAAGIFSGAFTFGSQVVAGNGLKLSSGKTIVFDNGLGTALTTLSAGNLQGGTSVLAEIQIQGYNPSTLAAGNIALHTSSGGSYGGGKLVLFIANANTDPTSDPTGGGILYVSGGALKYRGSSGTVTTIAAA